jgi:triphosphoribosyl-dephospho-CoA synthase
MPLSLSECLTLACLLEATAPKPGNVHRGADFDDLTFGDMAVSAVVAGPALATAGNAGVGRAILTAVEATRQVVPTNSNLGMVLLLAPLAAASSRASLRVGVQEVLAGLTAEDACHLWQAIAIAQPGGMGKVDEHDVAGPPPRSIVAAMQLAAARDRIAAQYANGFEDVFERVVPSLIADNARYHSLNAAIVHTHVRLLAELPDTLIARKAGAEVADKAAAIAREVLAAGEPGDEAYHTALADFDFWLRADGRRRNPGTTADLIAAGLFIGLWEEQIAPPFR